MFAEDFGPGENRARLVKKLTQLYTNKYKIYLDFSLCIVYNHYRKRGKEQ